MSPKQKTIETQPKSVVAENQKLKVLLVEDSPDDAEVIRDILAQAAGQKYDLQLAGMLSEASTHLDQEQFDVILLDLSLPDSQGLDTVQKMIGKAPNIPIIVLTGLRDEAIAVKSLAKGAQDYLTKIRLDSDILVRAIRYAVERHTLQTELNAARQQAARERELQNLDRFSESASTHITAQSFGFAPLSEAGVDNFNILVQRWENLLDLAVERLTFKGKYNLSQELRSIADEIGFLKGGPRDVVEIYSTALRNKAEDATAKMVDTMTEEGRLLVLELMGYLAVYYRSNSWRPVQRES